MQDKKVKLPPIYNFGERSIVLHAGSLSDDKDTEYYDPELQVSKRTKQTLKSEQELKQSSSKALTTEVRYSEEDEIQQPAQNEPEAKDSDGDYPDDFESDSNTKRSKANERISTSSKKSRKSILDNLKPFFQSMNSVSAKSGRLLSVRSDAFKDRMAMEKEKRSSIRESHGALAYSVLNPQLENSKLDGEGEEAEEEDEERKNKSMALNNDETLYNQFSTYNLILQETLLENSVFFEKLKNEHEPENEDENEYHEDEKEKEKENESESEQGNDKEEENEKEEEEEKKSPILNAYDSEFIEKVELPDDSPVEIIEVQDSHDQVHEVKNFGATIEYSPEIIESQKTNKRRYRSAPRQARKSITEQDDDSPIPREDQSYVHEIKSRVKASVEITKAQEVETKPVNESIEPISTLAVTMPVPVTVSKPVVLAATMPNNQRNINNSKSVVKARPRVFLNDTTKQQDLNRYKKPGMESSQKLILPTKKPPVPRCVSVPRKPVAVNMSQNLDESINKGVMRSKARMNKLPIVIQQNATQPRKLNSDTYFSDKIANIIMYHTGGKNDADLFYQNNVLIKQIAQISGFLKNLKVKEEKKKRSIPEGKLAWILDEIRINQHIIETRTEEYNRLCGLMEKATNVEYRINLDKEIKATKELCKKEEREMRNLDFLDKKELYSHPSTKSFSYANVPPHIQAMIRMNHINSAMDSYKRQELNLKEKNKKMALQRVQQESYLKVLEDRHQQLQADYDELEGEYIVDENGQKMHTKLFSSGKLQIFVNPATEGDEDALEILKKEIELEERLLEMNKQEIERKIGILEDLNLEINKLRELCPGTDEVLLDYRDSAEFGKSSEYYQNSANLSIECKSFLKNDSTILISYDQEIEKMDDMLNSKIGHRMIYKSGDCSLENSAVKANYEESQKRKFQEAYDDGQVIVKGKSIYSKQSSNMSQLKEKTESQNDNKMTGKSEIQSEKKEDLVVSQVIQGMESKTMITSNQNIVTKKESSIKGSSNLTEDHVKEPSTKEIKEEIISHSVTHTNPKTVSDNRQLASQIDTSIHTSIIEGSSIHPTQKVTESIQNQTVNKTNSIELTSDHTVPATIPAIDKALTKKTTDDSFPPPEKDHENSKRSDNSQVVSTKKENSFRSGVDTKDLTNLQSYRQPSVKRQGTGSVKTNRTPLVKDSEAEYLAEEFEDDSSMRNPPKSKSIYSSARVSQKEGSKSHNNTPSEAKSIKTQIENERIETGSFQPELNSKDVANFQPSTKRDGVTSTKRYQTPQAKDSEAEYLAEGFEDDSSMRNPPKTKSIYSSARGQTDLKSGKTQTEGGTTGVPMSHKESHFQPELNARDVMNFQPSSKRDGFISAKTHQTPQGKDSEAEYLAEGFEDDSSLRAPDRVKSVYSSEKHSKNGNTPAGLSSNRVKLGNESVEQVNQSQAKQKEAVLFTFQDADNDESGNLVKIMGIGQLGNASQSNETIMNRGSGSLMQNKKKTKREELNDSDEDYNLNYSAKNLPEVKNTKKESKIESMKKTDISPGSTKNNRYEINSEE